MIHNGRIKIHGRRAAADGLWQGGGVSQPPASSVLHRAARAEDAVRGAIEQVDVVVRGGRHARGGLRHRSSS